MMLLAVGVFVSCRDGKPADARNGGAAVDSGAAQPAEPVDETPLAPDLTAAEVASQILRAELSLAGYSIEEPLKCVPRDNPGDWTLSCRAGLVNSEQGGKALLEFRLFDHETFFSEQDVSVAAHVDSLDHTYSLHTKPSMRITPKGGVKRRIAIGCHQSLGPHNSPAYCTLMFNSRILILTGVSPARPSTRNLKLGEGEEAAGEDVNRAADLAMVVALQLRRVVVEERK